MSSFDFSSVYRFSEHFNDKVTPDLSLGDIAHIVTLTKVALGDDSSRDPLFVYLDGFITDYLDSLNG